MATMHEMTETISEQLWTAFAGFFGHEPDGLAEEHFQMAAEWLGSSIEHVKRSVRRAQNTGFPAWSELDAGSQRLWRDFVADQILPNVISPLTDVQRNYLQGRN